MDGACPVLGERLQTGAEMLFDYPGGRKSKAQDGGRSNQPGGASSLPTKSVIPEKDTGRP
jgi:hypothetical protein